MKTDRRDFITKLLGELSAGVIGQKLGARETLRLTAVFYVISVIALESPVLATRIGRGAPFVFFAVMTAVEFLVVLFVYPETKGQTLEELRRRLVKAAPDEPQMAAPR